MKNYCKKIGTALLLLLLPALAMAQDLSPLEPTPKGWSVMELLASLMNRIPIFLGGFALLGLLYSGALYLFAMGDPSRMEVAKKNITWTVIGIIAVSLVYTVIKVAIYITGKAEIGPGLGGG